MRARRVARGIELSGDVTSAALADRALRLAAAAMPKDTIVENELHVTGMQQVSLEVLIAEVQRSLTEDFGVNWEAFRKPRQGSVRLPDRSSRKLHPLDAELGFGLLSAEPTWTDRYPPACSSADRSGTPA